MFRERTSVPAQIETLEDRVLLTDFDVDTDLDNFDPLNPTTDGLISLREAILAANTNAIVGDAPAGDAAGDTITFSLAANSTIMLEFGQLPTITDNLTISGVDTATELVDLNITIDAAASSRIFQIDVTEATGGNAVRINDLTLTNGLEETANGGGILIGDGEDMTLSGVTVQNSIALNGGGIYTGDGDLTIRQSQLAANALLPSSLIAGNTATNAIDGGGGGGLFNDGGEVTVTGTNVTGNTVDNDLVTVGIQGSGDGGGIFNNTGGFLSITGSLVGATQTGVISGNQTGRAGGGIENNAGTTILTDAILGGALLADGNIAGVNGGGLHNSGAGTATISGGIVQNNTAGEEGGGLWNSSAGDIVIQQSGGGGTLIQANTANGDGTEQGGGGIFNDGGEVDIVGATVTLNVSTAEAIGNGGGGIFNDGTMELVGTDVTGNTANANQGSGGVGSGGGIFNSDGGSLTVRSSSTISGNLAAGAGGGIENNGGIVFLTNMTLGGPLLADRNSAGVNGGGLHTSGAGMVTVNGSTIQNNTAGEEGGGLWNSLTGMLIITDTAGTVLIDGNIASGNTSTDPDGVGGDPPNNNLLQGGGGIFNDGGILTINDISVPNAVTLSNNQADGLDGAGVTPGSGGGILSIGGTVNITGAAIDGNEAIRAGGGIEIAGGNATLTNIELTGNDASAAGSLVTAAPGNGGGLHITAGTVTINNSTVARNSAESQGGGLWVGTGGTLNVNTSIVGGTAADQRNFAFAGGGLYNAGGNLNLSQSTVAFNAAAAVGGGLAQVTDSGVTTFINSTISGNSAEGGEGGGIYTDAGTITLVNVTVEGNTASGEGDGISVDNVAAIVNADNSIFSHSTGGGSDDVAGAVFGDFNLIHEPIATADVIGSGNIFGVDPLLGGLANTGGATPTHAVPAGSSALDAGNNALAVNPNSGIPLATDQRGFNRIAAGTVDIGAFETSDDDVDRLVKTDLTIFDAQANSLNGEVHNGLRLPGAFSDIGAAAQFPANLDFTFVLDADVNNDKISDYVGFADNGNVGEFYVAVSDGLGGLTVSVWATGLQTSVLWRSFHVGDFNNDGNQDIIGFSNGSFGGSPGQWYAFLSNPVANAFSLSTGGAGVASDDWAIGSAWDTVFVGDFNGDSFTDVGGYTIGLFGPDSAQVYIALSDGMSTSAPVAFASNLPNTELVATVQVGDFNGDDTDDLAVFADDGDSGPDARWLTGVSNGVNALTFSILDDDWAIAGVFVALGVGDFDGDGRDDVYGRSNLGQLSGLFVKTTDPAKASLSTLWEAGIRDGSQFQRTVVADFNNDGTDDVLTAFLDGELQVAESLALSPTPQNAFESAVWGVEQLDALDRLFASDLE